MAEKVVKIIEKSEGPVNIGFSFETTQASGEFWARNSKQVEALVDIYLKKIKPMEVD